MSGKKFLGLFEYIRIIGKKLENKILIARHELFTKKTFVPCIPKLLVAANAMSGIVGSVG